MELKQCTGPCGETKPLTDFYFHKVGRPYAFCKVCHNARAAQRRVDKRDKVLEEKVNAKRYAAYGIDPEQFWELFIKQDGKCANPGCRADFDEAQWHTDHCHKDAHVRGLLCRWCNLTLGHAKDDLVRLKGLVEYMGLPPAIPAEELLGRGKKCRDCQERPPVPNRKQCQPCHNASEKAKRVERKARLRAMPCSVEGCEVLRHETPSQVLPWCTRHRDERLGRGVAVTSPGV